MNIQNITNENINILGAFCSPNLSDARAAIIHKLSPIVCWSSVLEIAINERLGPLMYYHLKEYGIRYPKDVNIILAAVIAKQRCISLNQSALLADIAEELNDREIPFLVMKGGSLAHTIYSDPAHRPMEDIDLLVPEEYCDLAQYSLDTLGFIAPNRNLGNRHFDHSHQLPTAHKKINQVVVNVEIHRTPLSFLMGSNFDSSSKQEPYVQIEVFGKNLKGLSAIQSIILAHTNLGKVNEKVRMIQIADIVGLFERYGSVLLKDDFGIYAGQVYSSLPSINIFSPIANFIADPDEIYVENHSLKRSVGKFYNGWPSARFGDCTSITDISYLLIETLSPPKWWMGVAYGIDINKSTIISRILIHFYNVYKQSRRRIYLGKSPSGYGFFGKRI